MQMGMLDQKTIDEADRAFDEQVYTLSDWEADVRKDDEAGNTVPEAGSGGETADEPAGSGGESRTVEIKVNVKPAANDGPVGKLTREQAKGLVRADYSDFGDVVGESGIDPDRLAEYTSVIPFWYKSFRDGKEKMGTMPKYPLFLDLFGVTEVTSISMGDIYRKFAPEKYEADMKADEQADRLARAAAEIVAKRGLDFGRELDEEDYGMLEKAGVDDPRKYRTVAEVTGLNPGVMEYDDSTNVVYNADYAEAMGGFMGQDTDGDVEVVPLEDVIAGLSPKFLKGFIGKEAGEIREVYDGPAEDGDDEPFIPFDMDGKSN